MQTVTVWSLLVLFNTRNTSWTASDKVQSCERIKTTLGDENTDTLYLYRPVDVTHRPPISGHEDYSRRNAQLSTMIVAKFCGSPSLQIDVREGSTELSSIPVLTVDPYQSYAGVPLRSGARDRENLDGRRA